MKILFIHQNFPGQFKFLAPALAQQGHQVSALLIGEPGTDIWQGVRRLYYQPLRGTTQNVHPWVSDFETKTIRAEACFRAALTLKSNGYTPDVVVAHPGWGESLFIKDVWPNARLGIYCEFFYHAEGADTNFDPEFSKSDTADVCRLRLKNLNNRLHLEMADAGISPTHWQASTFPESFQSKITVIHDGIDTDALTPSQNAAVILNGNLRLTKHDEIVTFVSRNLEPYRGYHIFMRSLPRLLRDRPNARILIVGGHDVSYGARPGKDKNWRDIFAQEVRSQISTTDWERIYFLGKIPYTDFISLMQVSTVHAYLTYPFVLSWSLLEAMSMGCTIVASNTQPLREVITAGDTGQLVDFFDSQALAEEIASLLADSNQRQRLGTRAREFVRKHYDLKSICLPHQLAWVHALAG